MENEERDLMQRDRTAKTKKSGKPKETNVAVAFCTVQFFSGNL